MIKKNQKISKGIFKGNIVVALFMKPVVALFMKRKEMWWKFYETYLKFINTK